MFRRKKSLDRLPDQAAPKKKPSGARKSLRRFFIFLIALALACGIYIVASNGLYYWYSQPIMSAFTSGRGQLDNGVPVAAVSESERLAYYQTCADQLTSLPDQLAMLNQQPWTFAVLIREDLDRTAIPSLLDKIERGRQAVKSYMAAILAITDESAAFRQQPAEPAEPAGQSLTEHLSWYTARIKAADHLETLFSDLAKIPDLDLAGRRLSREELGLDQVAAAVNGYRQAVLDLQALLRQSDLLETRLNALYALAPSADGNAGAQTSFIEMLAESDTLIRSGTTLQAGLPEKLQPVFAGWQSGLTKRKVFILALQTWWQDSVLIEQSLASAKTDRATAKRYIADSLAEENVETAYLWTKTAQEYQASMGTAIDFTNIYIGPDDRQPTGIPTGIRDGQRRTAACRNRGNQRRNLLAGELK
jgi:hypothetical protein